MIFYLIFNVLILIQEAGTSLRNYPPFADFCDVYIVHLLGIMKPGSKAFLFQVTNSLSLLLFMYFIRGYGVIEIESYLQRTAGISDSKFRHISFPRTRLTFLTRSSQSKDPQSYPVLRTAFRNTEYIVDSGRWGKSKPAVPIADCPKSQYHGYRTSSHTPYAPQTIQSSFLHDLPSLSCRFTR